jgi:hypothetical protein
MPSDPVDWSTARLFSRTPDMLNLGLPEWSAQLGLPGGGKIAWVRDPFSRQKACRFVFDAVGVPKAGKRTWTCPPQTSLLRFIAAAEVGHFFALVCPDPRQVHQADQLEAIRLDPEGQELSRHAVPIPGPHWGTTFDCTPDGDWMYAVTGVGEKVYSVPGASEGVCATSRVDAFSLGQHQGVSSKRSWAMGPVCWMACTLQGFLVFLEETAPLTFTVYSQKGELVHKWQLGPLLRLNPYSASIDDLPPRGSMRAYRGYNARQTSRRREPVLLKETGEIVVSVVEPLGGILGQDLVTGDALVARTVLVFR